VSNTVTRVTDREGERDSDTVVVHVRQNRLTGQTPPSNSVKPPRNRQNRPSKRAAGWDPRRWSVPHSGLGAGRARAAMRGLGDMVLAGALTQTAQYSVVSTSDRASSVPRPLPSNYVKAEPALGPPVKSVKVVKPPVKTTDPSGPLLPPYHHGTIQTVKKKKSGIRHKKSGIKRLKQR
jgi:hypothetical protein